MVKKLINIKLSEEFLVEIKEFAKKNELTVSSLIRLALKEYIKNHNGN